jgi:serine/threonine protein kinase
VAVKVLVASELDEGARKLFVDGAMRAAKLNSPAFIKIFDYSMKESPEFLVSEFVKGKQLSSYLRHYPHGLPLAEVKFILLGLAEALEEVHEQGFWRGNMCPSDILIQAPGLPRLSPFDFSNLLREDAQMSGNFLVDRESLAYTTPEWFFGKTDNTLTDQYSLGIVATELLGGSQIPRVKSPCDFELKRKLFAELESGKGEWAARSDQFTGVICRMLRTDPEERWPSMSRVRNLLRDIDAFESPDELHRKMAMASYLRLQRRGPDGVRKLVGRFYENLFSALPEVKGHFQSINMERQHRIVNRAIDTLLEFCPDSGTTKQKNLEDLAMRHAKFGLSRRQYDAFLKTWVETIKEHGENDPELVAAWSSTLKPGIDFMWNCQEKGLRDGGSLVKPTSEPSISERVGP